MSLFPKSWIGWTGVIFAIALLWALANPVMPFCGPSATRIRAESAVTALGCAIESYRTEYGSMPSGDSLAILSSLRGNNPKKTVFIEPPEKQIDAQGNFLDPWKSPYRIDISDPKNPKVWSLGKNKIDEHDDPKSDDICSWR